MRFSIKAMLIATLFVSLCSALVAVSHRLQRATTEVRNYRDELGHLNIKDPSKINFISVPQHEALKWRWRIRLPKDRAFQACFQSGNIKKAGFTRPSSTLYLDSGTEFTLTIVCHRDQLGEWNVTAMTTNGFSQGIGFLGPRHRLYFERELSCRSKLSGQDKTIAVDPNARVELLRLRIQNSDTDENNALTDDGLLVWLVERPNS